MSKKDDTTKGVLTYEDMLRAKETLEKNATIDLHPFFLMNPHFGERFKKELDEYKRLEEKRKTDLGRTLLGEDDE